MAFDKYVKLPGSERKPMRGAKKSGVLNPRESMQVTVVLRERASAWQTTIGGGASSKWPANLS